MDGSSTDVERLEYKTNRRDKRKAHHRFGAVAGQRPTGERRLERPAEPRWPGDRAALAGPEAAVPVDRVAGDRGRRRPAGRGPRGPVRIRPGAAGVPVHGGEERLLRRAVQPGAV